ncbi:MAG: methylenetetrahydrofolate reductase [Clostridiales bacterium]|jgi:methylenetetrahydrofolate reductase (NADPH)|nr:methylenetetrahydrofolate reductase [Clostridiales bacterium]
MKIIDIIKSKKPTLSFEIFPPKEGVVLNTDAILSGLTALKPDFISVTSGAGGGGGRGTLDVAQRIKNEFKTESIMHLVCSGADGASIGDALGRAEAFGIDNVLALRGDRVEPNAEFCHASDLIRVIDKRKFCVGAAAYPEGHIDSPSLNADLEYLKQKADLGADFFTTQLFFDNALFYNFREKARKNDIYTPILCGIMPILSKGQISRMIFMCGVSLPGEVVKILYKYENDEESLVKAGIEYAAKQIDGLIEHGAEGIHIYTMNKPEIAKKIIGASRKL